MKKIFSAGLVLFRLENYERRYLVLQYPHGHWDFVKGKIESGESKLDAANRELEEETGLKAEIVNEFEEQISYIFREDNELIDKTVFYFIGRTTQKDVVLSDEHTDFKWLSYHQAEGQLTFTNAKEILKKAELFLRQDVGFRF